MENDTENPFSVIPEGFGGLEASSDTAVLEKEEVIEAEETTQEEVSQGQEEAPEESKSKPEKSSSQFAQERRAAKAEKKFKAENYDSLLADKETLDQQLQDTQSQLEALQKAQEEVEGESLLDSETVETLRKENEMLKKRYTEQYAPDVSIQEDEQFKEFQAAQRSALKANIPRRIETVEGRKTINFEALAKDPERSRAMNTAVQQYAVAAESGDDAGMTQAISLLGTAIGHNDPDDQDVTDRLEDALIAASEPFAKSVYRQQEFMANAHQIAQQRRVEAIRATGDSLKSPFRFDPEQIKSTLAEHPENGWAHLGAEIQELPEETVKDLTASLDRDATVVGNLQFSPPPVPANATVEQIQEHQRLVEASQKHATGLAPYIAAGRAVIDGGMLRKYREKIQELEERLEEEAGSRSIPTGGAGGDNTVTPTENDAVVAAFGT